MKLFTSALFFLPLALLAEPGPLRFEAIPLGNAARILSARFHCPVTIRAGAQEPISGDFSGLDLKQALTEAARQAGLVVVPQGPAGGYCLERPKAVSPAEAAHRRSELLRLRARLLESDGPLAAGVPAG